jgi:glycosyltransferase involved in cell wall biosynthesis
MVETILEAAARLSGTPVRFLLVGDGDHKARLKAYASELRLDNLNFHDPVPKQEVIGILRRSHLALICTWDHPFQRMVLANKIFDYMASGTPIVAAARGEMADLIATADCGWSVDPERPEELAELIRSISRMPADALRQKGANGRAHVLQHYRRDRLADRLLDSFLEVLAREGKTLWQPTVT